MDRYHQFARRRRASSRIIEALLVIVAVVVALDFLNGHFLSPADQSVNTAELRAYAAQYLQVGEVEEAVALLNVALYHTASPAPELYAERGYAHMVGGQFTAAEADFSRAVALDPQNGEWHHALYLARLHIAPPVLQD